MSPSLFVKMFSDVLHVIRILFFFFFFSFLAAYFGKVFFKFLVIDYIFSFIVIFSFEKR